MIPALLVFGLPSLLLIQTIHNFVSGPKQQEKSPRDYLRDFHLYK